MAAKNDITGDSIKSKVSSKAYADGWDRIFGNKNKRNKKNNTKTNFKVNSPIV